MTTYIEFLDNVSTITTAAPYFNLAITVKKAPDGEYFSASTTSVWHEMSIGGGPEIFTEHGDYSGHTQGEMAAAFAFVHRATNGSADAEKQTKAQIDAGMQRVAKFMQQRGLAPIALVGSSKFSELAVMLTPAELKQARQTLGLDQTQMAAMLGLGAPTRVSEIENGRPTSPSVMRLMRAYLDGYRPDDWPQTKAPPA